MFLAHLARERGRKKESCEYCRLVIRTMRCNSIIFKEEEAKNGTCVRAHSSLLVVDEIP